MRTDEEEILQMDKKKVLILGNSHLVVFGFRGELIQRLIKDGYEVVVSFPNGPFGEGEETSKQYGCKFVETYIERRKTNPFSDLKLIKDYIKLIRNERPDVVLGYTVKCDVYGGIACRRTHSLFIPNITGIGKGLAEGGIVGKILIYLYKAGIKKAYIVFFQNESDKQFFVDKGIKFKRSKVLPGSGVNLDKFTPLEYPEKSTVIFTYIARIMKAKGIEQFLDAARALKGKAEFHICGYCEEDYKNVIEKEQKSGTIIYHGLVSNVTEYEKISHCIVLPTSHPEGVSNVLLEAVACARPIITTNRPGCRETVDDGITGYLIRERDSHDLIEKMEQFMNLSNSERKEMGLRGRRKIEKEFDRQIVVDEYIRELNKKLGS